ncbi:MAG: hypothetical protein M0R06_04730 [Sphaerochaeta sp.]|jgi:hypothetical protein|nr:hypothetical protein [Sphaerochaeta sp.]
MAFDMSRRVETQLLDDFDGEVVTAGFVTGQIPADKSVSHKATITHQLLLGIQPENVEGDADPKVQYGFYSMGKKTYKFGGKATIIRVGKEEDPTELELYPEIEEGPDLNKSSRLGLLLERLDALEYKVAGAEAGAFLGLRAHWKREAYEGDGASSERAVPMPIELLSGATKAAKAEQEKEEQLEMLIAAMDGQREADVPAVVKSARIKALGITAAKAFKLLDQAEKAGKIKKDGDTYHAVED